MHRRMTKCAGLFNKVVQPLTAARRVCSRCIRYWFFVSLVAARTPNEGTAEAQRLDCVLPSQRSTGFTPGRQG